MAIDWRVAEAGCRRMAARADVVVVQPAGLVEEQEPAEIREFRSIGRPSRRSIDDPTAPVKPTRCSSLRSCSSIFKDDSAGAGKDNASDETATAARHASGILLDIADVS